MISTHRLSQVFVDAADSLVAEFDLVDFLQKLVEHAAEVSGAQSVGLMLTDHDDTLRFMAASDDTGRMLELFQLQAEEGPCLDCFLTKSPVVNADLSAAADLWPVFAPAAYAAGFQSVHAFPMRLRDRVIGALNLFGHADSLFDDEDIRVVQALADVATIALLQERAVSRAEALAEQLQGALHSRIVIEQAKGALAQQQQISPTEAFEQMRRRSRSSNRRLADVAAQVLDQIGLPRPE